MAPAALLLQTRTTPREFFLPIFPPSPLEEFITINVTVDMTSGTR